MPERKVTTRQVRTGQKRPTPHFEETRSVEKPSRGRQLTSRPQLSGPHDVCRTIRPEEGQRPLHIGQLGVGTDDEQVPAAPVGRPAIDAGHHAESHQRVSKPGLAADKKRTP